MVSILPSGEIVQDDDPRARRAAANASSSKSSGGEQQQRRRGGPIGGVVRDEDRQEGAGGLLGGGGGGGGGGGLSIFQALNQRLLDAGLPRVNLWQGASLEPLALVGILLALIMFGLPGLLFAGVLFAVVHYSGAGGGGGGGGGRSAASSNSSADGRGDSRSVRGSGRVLGRH